MSLNTLRPSPLVDQATERLREEITTGRWPVGTKLPPENVLAQTLGVGRSTVREAIRALAGAGLVRARQGSGVFVIADTTVEPWPERLRRSAVTDVYEVRNLLEVAAADLAAHRRTPEDLTALHAALEHRRQASNGSNAEFIDADIALHCTVVAAAHNPALTTLFTEFVPLLRSSLIDLLELADMRTHEPNHGDDSHAALVDAIEREDGESAKSILRGELEATLARLEEVRAQPS